MSHQLVESMAVSPIEAYGPVSSGLQEASVMVYVGHICTRVENDSVQDLLSLCGDINKWTRQNDPISGAWVHFGFAEFKRPEGALRAIDFLDGLQLGSKKLVVKVDSKIAEKLDLMRSSSRFIKQNEDMIRSTVNALITTINQKWREEALARDTLRVETPTPPQPVLSATKTREVLPNWYKDSRRELDRLRAIERRKRDRESDFRRALEDWEKGPECRFIEEMENEGRQVQETLLKKQKLIEQDGIDGFKVRSNFTFADRKKEMEFDIKDKAAEEREIIEKQTRDKEEMLRLENDIKSVCNQQSVSREFRIVEPVPIPSNLPETVRSRVRRLPKNLPDIEIYRIDWDEILKNGDTMEKLHHWLPNRLMRTCKLSPELSSLVSSYFIKTIEVVHQPLVSEIVYKISSLLPPDSIDGIESVCARAFQLLIYSQSIQS